MLLLLLQLVLIAYYWFYVGSTPSDNTVSTAKLTADAVTGAKIGDDAVGAEHIEALTPSVCRRSSLSLVLQ